MRIGGRAGTSRVSEDGPQRCQEKSVVKEGDECIEEGQKFLLKRQWIGRTG